MARRPRCETTTPGVDSLVAMFRLTPKEAVKDVRQSELLTESAVCLVADESDRTCIWSAC